MHDFQRYRDLGESVLKEFRKHNLNDALFPAIAEQALHEFESEGAPEFTEIARFISETRIAQQPDVTFGDMAPVVFRCPHFYIELLYWMHGTTTIHQHGFSGAFKVIQGGSVHTLYSYQEKERVSGYLSLGDVRFESIEELRVGDARAIVEGRQGLIHSLYHLDQPSVTLVLRTGGLPWSLPQFGYFKCGIAFAHAELRKDKTVLMLSRVIRSAFRVDAEQSRAIITSEMPQMDLARIFTMVVHNYQFLATESSMALFTERVAEVHGSKARLLEALIAELKRNSTIATTRNTITDPDLRFFLAALLNAPHREAVLSLVKQRFPQSQPEVLCANWLAKLGEKQHHMAAFIEAAQKAQLGTYNFNVKLAAVLDPGIDEESRSKALLQVMHGGVAANALKEAECKEPVVTKIVSELRNLPELRLLFEN